MADLPTLSEIVALSESERRALMQRLGVTEAEVERVTMAGMRAAARVVRAGRPSEAVLIAVRDTTQRAISRELQHVTKDLVRQYTRRELGVTDATMERWVSTVDSRRCEDCEARHGSVQTHADWVADGEPGSPNTLCNGNCRCQLVPDDAFTGPYERGDVQVTVSLEA